MTKRIFFAFPGDLQTLTGGYGYDRRIIAGLRNNGWQVDEVPLGDGFPFPDVSELGAAEQSFAALPDGATVIIDGLGFGVMEQAAKNNADRLNLIALVHHPLCRENGIDAPTAARLEASEKAALAFANHVIVTSPATGEQVVELFDVDGNDLSVIVPGTDRFGHHRSSASGNVSLLTVGTIVPRKGYDLLLEALAGSKFQDWHLDIVGATNADPACYRATTELAEKLGIDGKVTFHGALDADRLIEAYRNADVFVLASRYEGYGMAYTEALAHGLPVIGSGAGAVAETLFGDGAIYCGVEDIAALRSALERVMSDSDERDRLASAAHETAKSLATWEDAAAKFQTILKQVGT